MANTKQQRKRVRTAQRQRLENLRYKSAIRTHFRRLKDSITAGDSETAAQTATKLTSAIDKAAARNAIHSNNAARKKSRVARLLSRLS
ncbi:MAG: 30S ribosomal protein S20 [Actinobacteria bacterium]|nr:30S ribosomal protein S20 [Actinomycetota bacterium]